jgi:hypothetical protein
MQIAMCEWQRAATSASMVNYALGLLLTCMRCLSVQVLQWVFAGAPGHPALREICDHIATHATTVFSNNTNRDTLERTGPGVWTDVILRHALQHPPAKVGKLETFLICTGMPRHISVGNPLKSSLRHMLSMVLVV